MWAYFFLLCLLAAESYITPANNTAMQPELTVRDVAADNRHPRHNDCKSIQSTKAWGFVCLFLRFNEIPGTKFPNRKEFSTERLAKKKWIEHLNSIYDTQPDDSHLFAVEADIMELPDSVAVAIPLLGSESVQLMPPFGSLLSERIGRKLFLRLRCLPDNSGVSTSEVPSLETRLYWLNSCLKRALIECEKEGIDTIALPYKFNCTIEGDEANWVRYKQVLSNWAKKYKTRCKLLIVGSPD